MFSTVLQGKLLYVYFMGDTTRKKKSLCTGLFIIRTLFCSLVKIVEKINTELIITYIKTSNKNVNTNIPVNNYHVVFLQVCTMQ